jgi:predicted metal-binding membrane protein
MADMAHAHSRAANVVERHPMDTAAGWPLMLTAMMAPLLIPALRHVYARSLPRRRGRAMTLLIVVYAATWAVGSLILQAVATALQATVRHGGAVTAVGLFAAVLWQLSAGKQVCLNRRHAHPPIAAFGRAADIDALRFGFTHACWCIGSCWALMLLPFLYHDSHLIVTAIVTLWIWAEPFDTPVRPTWRIRVPVNAARIVAATARPLWQRS